MIAVALPLVAAPSASAFIYWTAGTGQVGRANLEGSAVNAGFVSGSDERGLAVDGTHMYFFKYNDRIARANLDGSGRSTDLITGLSGVNGLAVDGSSVYFTNSIGGKEWIGRANLDGSGVVTSFVDPGGPAYGLAVDGAHLYWTKRNAAYRGVDSIGRANLDGTAADPGFISGGTCPGATTCTVAAPWGVAVVGGAIYWSNGFTRSIARANLDGSGVDANFITGLRGPWYLAVQDRYLYWADGLENSSAGSIGRANLDGNALNRDFIPGLTKPRGIAVAPLGPGSGATPGGAALALSLGGAGRQVLNDAKSLRVLITCGVACTADTTAKVTVNGRLLASWSGSESIPARTVRGARFRLSAQNFSRVRRALLAGKRVRFIATVTATDDGSGATSTRTRTWVVTLPDATTVRAEKAFTKLVYESYGDPGPVVSCSKRSRTRWTCSFEAYTGGGQRCQGPGAGTVRRSGSRYRATVDRSKVTCREE